MPALDSTTDNLSNSTPAAPSGKQNVAWQADPVSNDPRNISAYPLPATASLEGTIILDGDLGGTADTPEVIGIQGKPIDGGPTDGDVLKYSAASGKWEPTAFFNFADAEVVTASGTSATLAHTPNPPASLILVVDGQTLTAGGADYTLSGASIAFVTAPRSGANIQAWYRY